MNEQTLIIPQGTTKRPTAYWWQSDGKPTCNARPPQPDDPCPECGQGHLKYDGLFLLACPICKKVAAGGAFT